MEGADQRYTFATGQSTCRPEAVEKCEHAWTLRYWVNGRQVEKSFKKLIRSNRAVYRSGRKLAQDFQLQLTVDKRSGDITFADHMRPGRQNFGEAAEAFIARLPLAEGSRTAYL